MALVRALRRGGCIRNELRLIKRGHDPMLQSRDFATSIRREQPVIIPQPQPVNWAGRTAFVLGTGASLALAAYFYLGRPPIEANKNSGVRPPVPVKVTVGGAFSLLNQEGKVVTNQDFVGNWSLIYIGYTHCPEDCPRQLQKISEVVRHFAKIGPEVLPIFITADPERDNPSQLKLYLKEFHPKCVGLTGSPSDVRPVLWKFRAFFRRTDQYGSDYLVDHSLSIYLMNPKMECVRVFGPEYHVQSLVEAISKEMKNTMTN